MQLSTGFYYLTWDVYSASALYVNHIDNGAGTALVRLNAAGATDHCDLKRGFSGGAALSVGDVQAVGSTSCTVLSARTVVY